jgi:nucleoside-diphosphate-sugar epimerase
VKKILITGAAGVVARGVVPTLAEHFELRLLDVISYDPFADFDWVVGSITDPELLEKALGGIQAVVNFAVSGRPGTGKNTGLMFDVNVKGLYLLLEASERNKIQRFVHVGSTAPVIGHWYEGGKITVESPYTTAGRYSLTKMLQEEICKHVAQNSDLSIVVLRPWAPREGLVTKDEAGREVPRSYAPGLIDTQDFAQACRLAIETEDLGKFEVFHTVATREARERFDVERTERVLGFRAREDFESLK